MLGKDFVYAFTSYLLSEEHLGHSGGIVLGHEQACWEMYLIVSDVETFLSIW